MARFTRIETLSRMMESGVVPVFYHEDLDIAKNVLKACYDGGIRVFEFTNRADFAHEIFSELNKYAIRQMPDLIMGVGTVVDGGTTSLYIQLGANFVVSPVIREEMAGTCNTRKIPWIPGCGTLSEISHAEQLGAEIVKIFPATQVGGPEFVAAIKGPCPWTRIMPTGGVSPSRENLAKWFGAGVACVGMGSKLITEEILANKDFDGLTKKVEETLSILKEIRRSE